MHVKKDLHSRDEFITFGNDIGRAFKTARRKAPWIACLGGDFNSGKGLIALAIDQAISPEKYPRGIQRDTSVDWMLHPNFGRPKVVFQNFRWTRELSKQNFDQRLLEFAQSHPKAFVVIGSNIMRTENGRFADHFDYGSNGLDSDKLDMHIDVRRIPGDFSRRISLTFNESRLMPVSQGKPALQTTLTCLFNRHLRNPLFEP